MTPTSKRLVLASRGSALALRQAQIVVDVLRRDQADLEIEIQPVKTTGDRDRRPFPEIGSKGIFVAEVERYVLEGFADIAVHSAKDLTAELAQRCEIMAVPRRGPVHDVVIGGEGATGEERLGGLPPSARIGSSSMRRRALLFEARPDLDAVEFRGNLDTRLKKVSEGQVDAAILAAAGLERLSGETERDGGLDATWWIPAPGQGALALEALEHRDDVRDLVANVDDAGSHAELNCERAFATVVEGGCSVPLGCLARIDNGHLVATGYLGDPNGGPGLRDRISGSPNDAEELGRDLAEALLAAGGRELLAEIRSTEVPEVPAP